MGYYSFKVRSAVEVDLPQHMITIGVGVDAFSVQVNDLDGFLKSLTQEGVTVLETRRLDDHVAIEPIQEVQLLLGNTTLLTGGNDE